MKTFLVDHDRIIRSYTKDSQAPMSHSYTSNSERVEESKHVTPLQQSQEAYFRHIACDDKLDCNTIKNTQANMATKTAQAL